MKKESIVVARLALTPIVVCTRNRVCGSLGVCTCVCVGGGGGGGELGYGVWV